MIREVTNMNKHELYHNHNYVYLLTSNIINRCGDSLDTILFTWLVYLLTNSAGWSAIIFGINQATSVIIQPFIGPLVENMNKKKVLVLSDIARVLLVLYILYVYTQNMLSPLILAHVITPKLISELTKAIHKAIPTPRRAIFFIVNNSFENLIHIHNSHE